MCRNTDTCRHIGTSSIYSSATSKSQLLHPGLQCRAFHPQHCSSSARTCQNPVGGLESLQDMFALGSFEREKVPGGRLHGKLQVTQGHAKDETRRNDDRALDEVFHLADVSRPR